MKNVRLIVTEDGSHTLLVPELNEPYHSVHGAVQESRHVFIQNGLEEVARTKSEINILEIGFGTGLNAFLAMVFAIEHQIQVRYLSIEPFPLPEAVWRSLNHGEMVAEGKYRQIFERQHQTPWGEWGQIDPVFSLLKQGKTFEDFETDQIFGLVFFDAFAPEVQPELWTQQVFAKLRAAMTKGAVLVTYCCKGYVKRNLLAAGFAIEKLPGPPGKREMLRATNAGH